MHSPVQHRHLCSSGEQCWAKWNWSGHPGKARFMPEPTQQARQNPGCFQSTASVCSLSTATLALFRGRDRSKLSLLPLGMCNTFKQEQLRFGCWSGYNGTGQATWWYGPGRPVRAPGHSQSTPFLCVPTMATLAVLRGRARF